MTVPFDPEGHVITLHPYAVTAITQVCDCCDETTMHLSFKAFEDQDHVVDFSFPADQAQLVLEAIQTALAAVPAVSVDGSALAAVRWRVIDWDDGKEHS